MGFFDTLKSVANMVTGGSATVTLEVAPETGRTFKARINAEASSDLKIEKVYLKIEGYETVTVRLKKEFSAAGQSSSLSSNQGQERDENFTDTTYSQEMDVAPCLEMKAKETRAWEASFTIPEDAPPTYMGKKAKHEWRVYAALSVTGTDPASSWQVFTIR